MVQVKCSGIATRDGEPYSYYLKPEYYVKTIEVRKDDLKKLISSGIVEVDNLVLCKNGALRENNKGKAIYREEHRSADAPKEIKKFEKLLIAKDIDYGIYSGEINIRTGDEDQEVEITGKNGYLSIDMDVKTRDGWADVSLDFDCIYKGMYELTLITILTVIATPGGKVIKHSDRVKAEWKKITELAEWRKQQGQKG
jgi:hypothetical protein